MKNITLLALITLFIVTPLFSNKAIARDDRLQFPVADVLDAEEYQGKLSGNVAFYFGPQEYGLIEKDSGEFTSNKKTNAFNKSDKIACQWALLSALKSLEQRTLKEGGNAVVEIYSNYRNEKFSSESEYQCGAGAFIAGVTLKGRVVKLAQ